jgi:hypothetical protein
LSLSKRAITSTEDPPGAGTTILIGLSGQFCARADKGITLHIDAAAIRTKRRLKFRISKFMLFPFPN